MLYRARHTMLALLAAHALFFSAAAQVASPLLWQAPFLGPETALCRSTTNTPQTIPYNFGGVVFSPDGGTLFAAQGVGLNRPIPSNPDTASVAVVALRADSGQSKWRYPAEPTALPTPAPPYPFEPTLYAADDASMLYLSYQTLQSQIFTSAISAAGELKWTSTVFYPNGYSLDSFGLPSLSVAGDLWVPGAASGPKASVSAFDAVTGESTGGVAPPGDAILSAATEWTAQFDPSRSTLVFTAVNATSNFYFFAIDARTRFQVWWLTVPLPADCKQYGGCFRFSALTTAALYTLMPDTGRNIATLFGFSMATGQPLPNYPLQLPDASYVTTRRLVALPSGQLLFIRDTTLPDGLSCALVDPTSGQEVWSSATLQGVPLRTNSIVSADGRAAVFGGTCAGCSSNGTCTCSTGAKLYFVSLATGAVTAVETNATYAIPLTANPCTGGVDFLGGVPSDLNNPLAAPSSAFGHASSGALVWATAQQQEVSVAVGCAPATRTVAVAGAKFNSRQLLSLYQLPAAPPAAPQGAASGSSAPAALVVAGGVLGGAALLAAAAAAFAYRALLSRSLQRACGGAPEESPLLMK